MILQCRRCKKKAEQPKDRLMPIGWLGTMNMNSFKSTYLCDICFEPWRKKLQAKEDLSG